MEKQKRPAPSINEQFIDMQVGNDLTVQIIPNHTHEFLMATQDVANGYGVARNSISSILSYHKGELKENTHFIKGVGISDTLNSQPHKIFWTKAGIVRLGFFIKSERAKSFRDWAEAVILEKIAAPKIKALPKAEKRKHNRLTPERLLHIMADVIKIEDDKLRKSIASQLLNL